MKPTNKTRQKIYFTVQMLTGKAWTTLFTSNNLLSIKELKEHLSENRKCFPATKFRAIKKIESTEILDL